MIKGTVVSKSGEVVGGVIPSQWVGGNGVITAILVALFTSWVFCYCEKHKIGFKMPEGVPTGVAKAFAALVPGFFILASCCIIYAFCQLFGAKTLTIGTGTDSAAGKLTFNIDGLAKTIAPLRDACHWAGE